MKIVKSIPLAASLLAALVLLAACAFNAVQPGMSKAEVIALKGAPTRTVALATGTRLQYSGQPSGRWAIMVDLDDAGKVVASRQVLTLAEFSRIGVGQWTRDDVEREFGRPASTDRVRSWSGDVMTYRWLERDQPMFFWVFLDGAQVVQRTSQGMEFPFRFHDN